MLGSSGDVTDGVRAGGSGSDRELAGQLGDAVLDLLERGVERGIGANPHRVRDRPVQMGEPAELFVREVAHRHDQVTPSDYVVEVSWADARKGQPCRCATSVAAGWMRSAGCVPAEIDGIALAWRHKAGRGESARSCRANKHHPLRRHRCGNALVQSVPGQPQVGPAAVTLGAVPRHQSGVLGLAGPGDLPAREAGVRGSPRVRAWTPPKNEWLFTEQWGVDAAVSPPHILTAMVEEAVTVGDLVRLIQLEGGRVSPGGDDASARPLTEAPAGPLYELRLPTDSAIVGDPPTRGTW